MNTDKKWKEETQKAVEKTTADLEHTNSQKSVSEFLLLSSACPALRIAIALVFFASGAAVALLMPDRAWFGVPVALAGWLPLLLRTQNNAPHDKGEQNWRAVTMETVGKIQHNLAQSIKAKKGTAGGLMLKTVFAAVMGFALFFGTEGIEKVYCALAVVYLVPCLFFGSIKVFSPVELTIKMPCYQWFINSGFDKNIVITPSIRFDKDTNGGDVPEDIRIMISAADQPADFMGIQVQCAVNKGPEGVVPYLYAVALTKGKGKSYRKALDFKAPGYIVEETEGSGEYGAVVIRQNAELKNGYETNESKAKMLAKNCGLLIDIICTKA